MERKTYCSSTSTFAQRKSLMNTWVGSYKTLRIQNAPRRGHNTTKLSFEATGTSIQDATQHTPSQQTSAIVPSCQVLLLGYVRQERYTVILVRVSCSLTRLANSNQIMGDFPKVLSRVREQRTFHAKIDCSYNRLSVNFKTRLDHTHRIHMLVTKLECSCLIRC